jgi:hypothetical protein
MLETANLRLERLRRCDGLSRFFFFVSLDVMCWQAKAMQRLKAFDGFSRQKKRN